MFLIDPSVVDRWNLKAQHGLPRRSSNFMLRSVTPCRTVYSIFFKVISAAGVYWNYMPAQVTSTFLLRFCSKFGGVESLFNKEISKIATFPRSRLCARMYQNITVYFGMSLPPPEIVILEIMFCGSHWYDIQMNWNRIFKNFFLQNLDFILKIICPSRVLRRKNHMNTNVIINFFWMQLNVTSCVFSDSRLGIHAKTAFLTPKTLSCESCKPKHVFNH